MRVVTKLPEPHVLSANAAAWLDEYLLDLGNSTKRYRYRHPEIKETLLTETSNKCVYCESRVGHNTPGDVEHKVPSSKDRTQHFSWVNLTIACTECNRRKGAYYLAHDGFLDPYLDNPDDFLEHNGPVVTPKVGNPRAEIFVETLKLCSDERIALVAQKISKLQELQHVLVRYNAEPAGPLREVLKRRLSDMAKPSAEYSAMIRDALRGKGYEDVL